jgi:hypothetical protein
MTKSMAALSKNNGTLFATTEKVADILEREMDFVIHDWMEMVEKQEDLDVAGSEPRRCRDLSGTISARRLKWSLDRKL